MDLNVLNTRGEQNVASDRSNEVVDALRSEIEARIGELKPESTIRRFALLQVCYFWFQRSTAFQRCRPARARNCL
jgi:hypothetical protein